MNPWESRNEPVIRCPTLPDRRSDLSGYVGWVFDKTKPAISTLVRKVSGVGWIVTVSVRIKGVVNITGWLKRFEQITMDKPKAEVPESVAEKQTAEPPPNEDYDKQAKAAGFMIGVSGEIYTQTVSRASAVYIERFGRRWEAWRETYQAGRLQAVSEKTIAKGQTLDYVFRKAAGYFDYIESKRSG